MPDSLDLHLVQPAQLNIFVNTARIGSFSETARTLALSQSAVSQAIERLEKQLGFALFDRSVRPPRLTERGQEVLSLAQSVVDESSRFLRAVEAIKTSRVCSLRFGITEAAASYASSDLEAALIPAVQHFEAQWGLIPKILKDFREGRLDIAIAPDIPSEDRFLALRLVSEKYLIVHPRTDAIDRDMLPAESICAHLRLPFVSYRRESMDWRKSLAMMRILGISVSDRILVENTQSVTNAVVRGLGWTILPPTSLWCVRDQLDRVTVHQIGSASIEKTLWVAARTLRFAPMARRIADIYRERLVKTWMPELARRKPIIPQFIEVGRDDPSDRKP